MQKNEQIRKSEFLKFILDNLLGNPYDRCGKGVAAICPQTQDVCASMDFLASERYAAPHGAAG